MNASSASQNKATPKPGVLGGMLLRLLIQRLFLPTLALLILALGLAGWTSHRSLDAQQRELAQVLANTVETFLLNAEKMIRSSAKVADMSEPVQLALYLKSSREGFGYFDTIYRLDKNGTIVQMEPHEPRYMGLDQTRQPYFAQAKTRQGLYISKPFNSIRTGKPTVIMTWPLAESGMMVAELNLGTFQEAVTAAQHETSKSTIIIVDQTGTFIAHPQPELIAQQAQIVDMPILQPQKAETITMHYRANNRWMQGSTIRISRTGWVVLIQAPLAVIYGTLIEIAIPLLLLCIGIWTIVVLTFRNRFSRHVISPLTNLSQTAIAISSGDLKRTAKVEKEDEIGIVARAFNIMTAQMREIIGHLEKRVDQLTRTREELKIHQEQLEALVETRTAALSERTAQLETQALELSAAKQQAEAANASKSDFLARMSHEIRTPLNAVTGLTNIVLKSELTEEQRDYLDKVQIASNNLMDVINDILDFSKVEAGRLELSRATFDLNQLLDHLADLFSDRLSQKDLELIIAISPSTPRLLIGDAARLTQVLTNLVANAAKFTNQGKIVVSVEPDDQAHQRREQAILKFQVKDTGAGIAADMLHTLFDPFTQADSSLTREHRGTGLGLAICQRLVELMDGKIWAHSTLGKGSSFSFTVVLDTSMEMLEQPKAAAPSKQKELSVIEAQRLAGRRVLVVEDSALNRDVAVALLKETGLAVETTKNGQDAVAKVTKSPKDYYDAVFMDIQMPVMDGYQATRHIREWEQQYTVEDHAPTGRETSGHRKQSTDHRPPDSIHRLPIIALTAHALKGEKEKCLAADMDDYVAKPINEQNLHQVLLKWILPKQNGKSHD